MNREIKFRAWDVRENMWLTSIEVSAIISAHQRGEPPVYYELMQFTGLHDKNGVPIFEGDIIECYQAPINTVHWYWDAWCYENYHAQSLPLGGLGNPYKNNGNLDCEVIGNIYQNPELK